jgi:hypothetical protein
MIRDMKVPAGGLRGVENTPAEHCPLNTHISSLRLTTNDEIDQIKEPVE